MKRFIGPSLLALMIAGGSSFAMAQGAAPDTSSQPPAATEAQPSAPAESSDKMNAPDAMAPTSPSAKSATDSTIEKTYTNAEAKEWVGKRIYSSNGDDIGEISAVVEGSDGNVKAFHADIGGFLGLGETRVRVEPSQLSLSDEKLMLPMTSEEAKTLPKVDQK